ncbi:MAG: IS1634 family transposase, partial [Pseudomonadales bacterium]|nr:IS1634 family transposase [Pseudomonadales bacterium]
LIVAHRPEVAREQATARDERIAALEAEAARWAGKLDGQEEGKAFRGRKLSDAGTTARFYKAVSDAHLAHIIKVNLTAQVFTYDIDERALNRARMMDGKLILVSNMPDHSPADILDRYKALADIERGFRVLKSEIEIAPVFHRLPTRIRAHALICFLALVIHRIMRQKLKAAGHPFSPRGALALLRQIQQHRIQLMANPSRVSDIFNPSRSSCSKHSNSCCPTPIASCSGIFAPSASMQSTTYSSSYGTWLFRTPAK